MADNTTIALGIAGALAVGSLALVDTSTTQDSAASIVAEASPTPTPTPTPNSDFPDWLLALPTIPASEQVYTTPETTPTQPKVLPTPVNK